MTTKELGLIGVTIVAVSLVVQNPVPIGGANPSKCTAFPPHKIVSSPALRARQTIEIVSEQLGHSQVKVDFDDDLYLASLDTLIESVQLYKNDVNSLMLVAHNPGLDYLVNDLLSRPINTNSGHIVMTTANLAIIEYKDSHFDPEKDKGSLIEFIQPKKLA